MFIAIWSRWSVCGGEGINRSFALGGIVHNIMDRKLGRIEALEECTASSFELKGTRFGRTSKSVMKDMRIGKSFSASARDLIGTLELNGRFFWVQSWDQVSSIDSGVHSAQPLINLFKVAACVSVTDDMFNVVE